MRTQRRLSEPTARLHSRANRSEKRALHTIGAVTCLLAIFISAGGHWAVLQSIAYTRMLIEFAEQDTLCTAVKKAFDERYACSLCPKIRDGYNSERKVPQTVTGNHCPDFLLQSSGFIFFSPAVRGDIAFVSLRHLDFSNAPPKPPPRAA